MGRGRGRDSAVVVVAPPVTVPRLLRSIRGLLHPSPLAGIEDADPTAAVYGAAPASMHVPWRSVSWPLRVRVRRLVGLGRALAMAALADTARIGASPPVDPQTHREAHGEADSSDSGSDGEEEEDGGAGEHNGEDPLVGEDGSGAAAGAAAAGAGSGHRPAAGGHSRGVSFGDASSVGSFSGGGDGTWVDGARGGVPSVGGLVRLSSLRGRALFSSLGGARATASSRFLLPVVDEGVGVGTGAGTIARGMSYGPSMGAGLGLGGETVQGTWSGRLPLPGRQGPGPGGSGEAGGLAVALSSPRRAVKSTEAAL